MPQTESSPTTRPAGASRPDVSAPAAAPVMRAAVAAPRRRCGAIALPDGSVTWRVWAPLAKRVDLVLLDGSKPQVVPMPAEADGHFALTRPNVPPGQKYAYRLNGSADDRADPASLYQPDGVAGPSAVVRTDQFKWTDAAWKGVERQDLVVYELHVGTFTEAGTFEAIIPRIDALKSLGVTAIEIMPVAQFPGDRNWGYDGVLPYATQNTYGGPQGLQKLVDAAHAKGMAVILDVVYNHLGPEHSYVREFGPYFTEKYKTPWGSAINYDDRGSDAVRDFVIDNARMWVEEFHLDGLRLDAVHAIYDFGATHILQEVHDAVAEVARRTGRHINVIAESDLNDPRILYGPERGGYGIEAQWSDDFHHAVHAFLTGERRGYYADYGDATELAKVFNDPFLGAGQFSKGRGRKHGAKPEGLSGDRFVVCIQNHDQVGNRAIGDRITTILEKSPHGEAKVRLGASLMLLAPYVPMLWMGEEYGERRPFPFFCSFGGEELKEAVRQGRKREFADFVDNPDEIPDPDSVATYQSARLSWSWPAGSREAGIRDLYGDLLAARRHWPALRNFDHRTATLLNNGELLQLIRGGPSTGGALHAYFNVSDKPQPLPATTVSVEQLLFSSESSRYGGTRGAADSQVRQLKPFECAVFGPGAWPTADKVQR